jgi:hypothetical protein
VSELYSLYNAHVAHSPVYSAGNAMGSPVNNRPLNAAWRTCLPGWIDNGVIVGLTSKYRITL